MTRNRRDPCLAAYHRLKLAPVPEDQGEPGRSGVVGASTPTDATELDKTEQSVKTVPAVATGRPVSAPARALLGLRRIIEHISDAAGWVSKWAVLGVFTVGIVNVTLRYLGRWTSQNLSSNRWLETQWYLFGIIFLFGFPYILKTQVNPRVDFWYTDFSLKRKALIDFVGHILFLLPFTWLAMRILWDPLLTSWGRTASGWNGWKVWNTWERSPDPGGLPRAPIKSAILLGFVMLFLQTIAELIKTGFVLAGRSDLVEIKVLEAPLRVE
jgi:TRAP-type mannitol/chloroaromatic compound transport system permease small subunit